MTINTIKDTHNKYLKTNQLSNYTVKSIINSQHSFLLTPVNPQTIKTLLAHSSEVVNSEFVFYSSSR